MPRRPPNPDQLQLDVTLPTATALRAELADQVKRQTKRKRAYFSSWPNPGTRVSLHWGCEEVEYASEPGEVVQKRWDSTRGGYYLIVRLDREGAPPVTVDELWALSPLEEKE